MSSMAPVSSRAGLPAAWRVPLLQLMVLTLVLLGAQWPAARGMALLWWRSETFAHGLLVLPISAWLIWRLRTQLGALQPVAWLPGLMLLVPAVLVGAAGSLAEVNVLQHFAVIVSLQALVLIVLGRQVAWTIAFPLAFLLFAPPFGEFMTEPMMVWTADFTVAALRATGVPVYREGLNFIIPSGSWSVVEACSGVRYLMASFMVGTLFAYLNFSSLRRRVAFMAVAVVMPIVANWVRAYLIVMLGHVSNNRIATGVDHLVYGWIFFGVVMLLMFWVGGRFADAPLTPLVPSAARSVGHAARRWPALLAAAVMLLPAVAVHRLQAAQPAGIAAPPLARVDGAEAPALVGWEPRFVRADAVLRQSMAASGASVQFDVGAWAAQRDGAKAVSSSNILAPSDDTRWLLLGGAGGGMQRWLLRPVVGDAMPHLSRTLWWVDGRTTASARQAKLWSLQQLLSGRGDAAAMIVLITPEADGGAARLDAAWAQLQPPLNERLSAWAAQAGRQNSAATP